MQMEKIIPDFLLTLQDLQNKNNREIKEALYDLSPAERRLMAHQVKRLYQILDIENQITFGTSVIGGYVAGIRYKNDSPHQVLIDGPNCHKWQSIELVQKTA